MGTPTILLVGGAGIGRRNGDIHHPPDWEWGHPPSSWSEWGAARNGDTHHPPGWNGRGEAEWSQWGHPPISGGPEWGHPPISAGVQVGTPTILFGGWNGDTHQFRRASGMGTPTNFGRRPEWGHPLTSGSRMGTPTISGSIRVGKPEWGHPRSSWGTLDGDSQQIRTWRRGHPPISSRGNRDLFRRLASSAAHHINR